MAYLAAMGVGDPVMTLMRKTPAASVRWLSLAELKASHLATLALDAAEPILTSGANGLNGRAFDGEPPRADLVQASIVRPVAGGGATLEIAFRYRRGGGAVEVEAIARGPETLPTGRSARPGPKPEKRDRRRTGAGESRRCDARSRPGPQRALLRALAHGRVTIASTPPERPQGFAPIELAALDGEKTLIAEACP